MSHNRKVISISMSEGKYVRAPCYQSDPEELDDQSDASLGNDPDDVGDEGKLCDSDGCGTGGFGFCPEEELGEDGRSTASVDDEEERNAVGLGGSNSENADTDPSSVHPENQDYGRRMQQMENMLNQLVKVMVPNQSVVGANAIPYEEDNSWNTSNVNVGASTSSANVRWENIQPFPDNVPANRMWEQWNRFIDRFEIAASLSNICDPVKRSQILFLSMREKLQRITRAARLRPSLEEPSCYAFFVRNIEGYLRSMVDVTAEHEAFTNLKQEANEPVMDFHSRLMEKVRLCGYSSADQERFVRAQLLKGMRNKELVKSARTFGYDTLFIVQSATREEAFMDESAQTEPSQALALTRNRPRTSGEARHWKQTNESTADRWTRPRRRETDEKRNRGLGRRSRCSKCDRLFHKFGSCPAVNSNCNKCGLRGHFAVVCRKKDANQLQVERNHEAEWESDRDAGKVNQKMIQY